MTRRFDDRYPDEYRDAEAGTDAADLGEARVNLFDRFRVSDGTRPRASAQGQGSWTAQQLSNA